MSSAQKNTVKIFCIGSNLESFHCLQHLMKKGCSIDTLITLPKGQDKNVSDYYDLHEFCEENGINVIDTQNVNNQETIEKIRKRGADYLFTLGWSQIFKKDFIHCFSKFIVGTHPSKLPYGRGRAPLPWTILHGLEESAVSFFKIDSGVDTGQLIFQRKFEVSKGAYVGELYDQVSNELAEGFYEIYNDIVQNRPIQLFKQDEANATIRGKRGPSDGLIEFDRDIDEVEKLIRAVSKPYPGAYCYYKDEKIVFWEVEFSDEQNYSGTLGQILKKGGNGLLIQFADGNLWLNRPSFDDGEAVDLKFFRLGDKLGYNLQDQIFYLRRQLSK